MQMRFLQRAHAWSRASAITDWLAAIVSSLIPFFHFQFWLLATRVVSTRTFLVVIGLRPAPRRSFLLGWLTRAVFLLRRLYWLTYSMTIRRITSVGCLPPAGSGADLVGCFPEFFCLRAGARDSRVGNQGVAPRALFLVSARMGQTSR